jgi:hypothetical protein
VKYWASVQKAQLSQLKVNYLGHIVILGELTLVPKKMGLLKIKVS